MRHLLFSRMLTALFGGLLAALMGCASPTVPESSLREALTFYSSFDQGVHADHALGDKQLYSASSRATLPTAQPGLPETDSIKLVPSEDRDGKALRYSKKNEAILFYQGEQNFDYQPTNWSGSISFWLKLNPDEDLEPGYCDPLQIAAGDWNNGVFFAEFSKDKPRRFRFALRPLQSIWNPNNLGWEEIPVAERPMVEVVAPSFSREQWTHVVFSFHHANTGAKNGSGRLYLNGQSVGEFRDWNLALKWQPEKIQVNIGAAYVGLFDGLALFNRALNDQEVQTIFSGKNNLQKLIRRKE